MLLVDYCVGVEGTSNACGVDPATLTPGFIADNEATGNQIIGNTLINNGTNPNLLHPFAFAAADITLFTLEPTLSNCFENNVFTNYFSLYEVYGVFYGLPACTP